MLSDIEASAAGVSAVPVCLCRHEGRVQSRRAAARAVRRVKTGRFMCVVDFAKTGQMVVLSLSRENRDARASRSRAAWRWR